MKTYNILIIFLQETIWGISLKNQCRTISTCLTLWIIQFQWKITGEVRDIAGFECKKAITKINDSVVVVAFYTDQILVKGGPENFNGLPGMILGLAVPRLALTLFATKLELTTPPLAFNLPSKPKFVKHSQIALDVEKGLKNWGKEGKAIAWISNL